VPVTEELRSVLALLEQELRRMGLWEAVPPPLAALSSVLPFCVDTLEFTQWLQWILLPRLHAVLDAGAALPARCGIAPMAEEALRGLEPDPDGLVELLRQLDRLLSHAQAC
jgi:uncharacterized protein YqcC (DUF446 family)